MFSLPSRSLGPAHSSNSASLHMSSSIMPLSSTPSLSSVSSPGHNIRAHHRVPETTSAFLSEAAASGAPRTSRFAEPAVSGGFFLLQFLSDTILGGMGQRLLPLPVLLPHILFINLCVFIQESWKGCYVLILISCQQGSPSPSTMQFLVGRGSLGGV